jgi:capsid portal protein
MQRYVFQAHKFDAIKLPVIVEKKTKQWVDFGEKNLYPDLLINLLNTSAIHHTCVESKQDAIYGEGFKNYGETILNSEDETLNEVFEKIVKDYVVFGGYALNIIWSRDGSKIAEIYHIPFDHVRSGKMNDDDKIDSYWYCSDWARFRQNPPIEYRAYSSTENRGDNASQIYYCFDYTLGQSFYPLPAYVGAINDIDIDARVSRFHSSNLSNGLAPSMLLTFRNGIPSEDEQDQIWRDINDTFAGEDNAGRAFINFSEPGREPTLTPIENANDDFYVTLEQRIMSRILTAHRITSPKLLGVVDPSGFSSNAEEIQTAFNHFLGTVIIPDQKKLTKSLKKILRAFGLNVTLEIEQTTIMYTVDVEEVVEEDIQDTVEDTIETNQE